MLRPAFRLSARIWIWVAMYSASSFTQPSNAEPRVCCQGTHRVGGLEDQEPATLTSQLEPDRQPGLARTDHDDLDTVTITSLRPR